MKALLACLFITVSLVAGIVTAEVAEAETILGGLTKHLHSSGTFHSTTAVRDLEMLLESGTGKAERLSAKVLLCFYLADSVASRQEADASKRIRDLCATVVDEAPRSWQGDVARVLLANERGFAGDYEAQIALASNALENIDFQALEAESDSVLLAIRHALGDRPYVFREVLKYTLAIALAKTGRPAQAEEIRQAIADAEFKAAAEKQLRRMDTIRSRNQTGVSSDHTHTNPVRDRGSMLPARNPGGSAEPAR